MQINTMYLLYGVIAYRPLQIPSLPEAYLHQQKQIQQYEVMHFHSRGGMPAFFTRPFA